MRLNWQRPVLVLCAVMLAVGMLSCTSDEGSEVAPVAGAERRGAPARASFPTVVRGSDGARAVYALFVAPSPMPGRKSTVEFAVFADGEVVRLDRRKDGPSVLRRGTTSSEAVARLSRDARRALSDYDRGGYFFGPDAGYTALTIEPINGSTPVHVGTWHLGTEGQSRVVVGDGGLTSRDGRSDAEVRATWTSRYRRFRVAWDEARKAADKLDVQWQGPVNAEGYEVKG